MPVARQLIAVAYLNKVLSFNGCLEPNQPAVRRQCTQTHAGADIIMRNRLTLMRSTYTYAQCLAGPPGGVKLLPCACETSLVNRTCNLTLPVSPCKPMVSSAASNF
jgi:hypothetical protein